MGVGEGRLACCSISTNIICCFWLEPVRLSEEQSFTTVEGFDPILGHVYDQDTGNLRAQQEGFRAARKKGETLLNYQEVRVRLMHQTLDRYIDTPT